MVDHFGGSGSNEDLGRGLAVLSLCKWNTQNAQLPLAHTYGPRDVSMPGLSVSQGHVQLLSVATAVSFGFLLPWVFGRYLLGS